MEGWNERADVLLLKHDQKLYVDVTVVRPTAASRIHSHAAQTLPGHALRAATQAKHHRYQSLCARNGYEMFAFALESYGGVGVDTVRLIKILAAHSNLSNTAMDQRQFTQHAYRKLAAVLQTANANIALVGQQQHYLSRHSAMQRHPAWGYPLGPGHHRPVDSGRLRWRVEPELRAAESERRDVAAVHAHALGRCGESQSRVAWRGGFGLPYAETASEPNCVVGAPRGRCDWQRSVRAA
jgi:hypothetical protein